MYAFGMPTMFSGVTPTPAMYQNFAAQLAAANGLGMSPGMGLNMTNGMLDPGYGMTGVGGLNMPAFQPLPMPEEDAPKNAFWKTSLCFRWQEGKCADSATCKFAHGDHELRPLDPVKAEWMQQKKAAAKLQQSQGVTVPKPASDVRDAVRKTRLCTEFMRKGICSFADRCNFAHGQHELRPSASAAAATGLVGGYQIIKPAAAVSAGTGGTKSTNPCHAFARTGVCPYGAQCRYTHIPANKTMSNTTGNGASDGTFSDETQLLGKRALAGGQEQGRAAKRTQSAPNSAAPAPSSSALSGDAPAPLLTHPDCSLCCYLASLDKEELVRALQGLGSPKAQQVGCMLVAQTRALGNLWATLAPSKLRTWLAKSGVSIMDRLLLLRMLAFHVHVPDPMYDNSRFVEAGLSDRVADFVMMCVDGMEGTASMEEYSKMLEVIKALFDFDDEQYYTVSTAVASFMMV